MTRSVEVLERDGPSATRRNGKDAGAEVVAADPFDETWVDAAPHFGFEGDAGLLRLDDDAIDMRPLTSSANPETRAPSGSGNTSSPSRTRRGRCERPASRESARQSGDGHLVARLLEHQRRGGAASSRTNEEHRRAHGHGRLERLFRQRPRLRRAGRRNQAGIAAHAVIPGAGRAGPP